MNSAQTLSFKAIDFEPLSRQQELESLPRPSLSFWKNAGHNLVHSPRAVISFSLIILLLSFSFVLPLFVKLDPYVQDLGQISRSPALARQALVVDDDPWPLTLIEHSSDIEQNPQLNGLKSADIPTTESVRLVWDPLPGAKFYRIYRHILPPSGKADLGLPLGQTRIAGQVSYEDRLKLDLRTYHYSVYGVLDDGQESGYQTLALELVPAITLNSAQRQNLIAADDHQISIGSYINLQPHYMGTDYLGRDILARLVYGGRTSLFIGLIAPILFVLIGVLYGAIAGYLGGTTDNLMMRFADFVIALPFLLFMILLRVAMGVGPGESGITPLLIALVVLGWPSAARLIRGQVLQIREQAYIQAAQLMGARARYIIARHLLPNVLGVVLVSLSFAIPGAIFTEAFLSFIGMGVAPPTPSWGSMCNDGVKSFLSHPHELLFPALFISITVLAFNLLGDSLRDALDVKAKP